MRKLITARWIGVAGAVVVLCGCTGGSAAEPDLTTGGTPPPAAGTSASPSASPSAWASTTASVSVPAADDGPVLTIEALPFPEASDVALPAPRQRALQQALDVTVRDSTRVPGVTAALLSSAGRWAGAAGVDGDGTALVPQAMTDVGSVTKTFTAAEVLLLAGQHRIDLDAPASTYLHHPLLARSPTVRQLLSHTSGIPDIFTPALVDAIDAQPSRLWTAGQALKYVTDPLGPVGPPVMSYSNSNYLLLGMLIEQATGMSYAAAVRRDLLSGLGPRIAVQTAEPPVAPVAAPNLAGTTTKPDGQFLPNRTWASLAGAAGGIAADAATLAHWGYRLYGGQVLGARATVELTTPVDPGYGLGTEILEPRWSTTGGVIGHHGNLPGYATLLLVNPQRQLAIAVLVPGDPGPTIDTLAERLLAVMSG